MGPYIQIIRKDGTTERHPLSEGEMILGRSANVDISVPQEAELDLEHILVIPRGKNGCWVSVVEGTAVPASVGGKPFTSGLLKWGTDIKIGSLRIRVAHDEEAKGKRLFDLHPGVLAAIVGTLAFVAWSSFNKRDTTPKIDAGRSRTHVELFAESVECPAPNDPARSAIEMEHVAHARGDRYGYDPSDGVLAVQNYHKAADCYRLSQELAKEKSMTAQANELQARIEADYAAVRLSLAHAIETKNWSQATEDSQRLILLTDHAEKGEYVTWLANIHRQVALKASYD